MSEEKLLDVNGVQSQWETPVGAQDMKLYSYRQGESCICCTSERGCLLRGNRIIRIQGAAGGITGTKYDEYWAGDG